MTEQRTIDPPPTIPSVSCIMLTHPPKEKYLPQAVSFFARQTLPGCELVIVHRDDQEFHDRLTLMVVGMNAQVVKVSPDTSLGRMRQAGADAASYDWIATWDDDDLHHPDRLHEQMSKVVATGAGFCTVGDYIHGYGERGAWRILRKWNVRSRGLRGSMVENSLIYNRKVFSDIKWPDMPKGEDTRFIDQLFARVASGGTPGHAVVVGQPWLFGYRHVTEGICPRSHHEHLRQSLADVPMDVYEHGSNYTRFLHQYAVILKGDHSFDWNGQLIRVRFPECLILSVESK